MRRVCAVPGWTSYVRPADEARSAALVRVPLTLLWAMASGIDPKLTALIDRLMFVFPWLNPQYGIHAGQKPNQSVRVDLGDGLIVVFSAERDKWTANSIVFDGNTPLFNNAVTAKMKGTDMVFLWAVTRIRSTYTDVAGMLRDESPSTAGWLDGQLARLNADLARPLA